ncbi:Lipoprotein [[Clostridium] ultunense Esp]|uniref:Lipoprotein n=1 Tax=[Clostridium] ultunense Esp TaxID=1288971 RepID=M1YVN1_9FIRM|nr:DUF3798 domain-containing protein [Schnuerera ultunensis]CCQ94620.1 Lipoprotein [[Clostridium] ultunense Esp]SHD76707.1 Lipoprotein [[Clostridium] ultunense Esp]
MKKRILALLLIGLLVISVAGCGKEDTATGGETEGEEVGFKIGLVTGTVSQGEEEFRAAENAVATYGSDVIKHVTYPDKFTQEQETTIAQITSLAADPDVKAIVVLQAVPGTAAAFDKIKETRDDILFIAGVPHEDPETIAPRADIILETDNIKRGETIVELAKEMGAKTFVHYSFPRHMSYELLAQRRDVMKETAEKLGLEFVEVDAPDPTGDAGIPGAQQFMIEDVPRQVDKYGEDTAFFNTNCSMQEPLIMSVINTGAIYPEQCCPSPYHAYPGALGIEIPEDKAGDVAYMLEQTHAKIEEAGASGRFATWKVPANMAMVEAAVEYAISYGKGEVEKFDKDKMVDILKAVTKDDNVPVSELEGAPNFLMFVAGSEIF